MLWVPGPVSYMNVALLDDQNMSSFLGNVVMRLSVWTFDGSVCYLVGEAHFCGDHL